MNETRPARWFVRLGLMAALIAPAFPAASAERVVVVNGERLAAQTLARLESGQRATIPNGRYWYDRRSGIWGRDGGPAAGQIPAGLNLGGPLREQASNGKTAVLVNGRRLPQVELTALTRLVGPIQPGRYWLDADGNAGLEGGPALVNLVDAHRRAMQGNYGGWNRNTYGGNWGGDGRCSYYSHPDGPSVLMGNC